MMSLQAGRHRSKVCRHLLRKDALSKDFLVIHFLLTQKTPRTCCTYSAQLCVVRLWDKTFETGVILWEINASFLGWVEDFHWEGEHARTVGCPGGLQILQALMTPSCAGQEGSQCPTLARILPVMNLGVGIVHLANGRAQSCSSFACSLA